MKRLFPCKIWKRGTAWVLAFSILFQTMAVSAHETVIGSSEGYSEQTEAVVTEGADPSETQPSSDAAETNPTVSEEEQTPSEQAFPEADSSTTAPQDPASQEQTQEEPKNITEICENGVIKIYNLRQLQSIGTGLAVRAYDMHEEQFGTGEEVLAEGQAITYSSDAAYMLMNEIALPSENIWTLPEGFTGTFAGTPAEDAVLYAKESDTVYVYNNYQLRLIASENSAEEPMMSSDMIPEKVGMGQLLYKDGTPAGESLDEAQEYLTYSKEHNYVLSPSFTEQMPELLSEQYVQTSADEVQKGGRDYIGQSYTTIEGEKYILIGNEQQLRAIGSDKRVTPMLFLRTEAGLLIKRIHIVPYYPGDADFNMDSFLDTGISYQPGDIETGSENFQYKYQSDEAKKKELMNIDWGSDTLLGDVVDIVGRLLGGLLGTLFGSQELVGLTVDGNNTPSIGAGKPWGANGEYTPFRDLEREYKDLKYSSDANYIIFRDIDLLQGEYSNGEDDNWTPIHFSGKMEGRLNMQADVSPTIKNIHVEQTGKLNMETTSGIGFFGTISNKLDENTLGSAGTAVVKNMHLEEVSVTNKSTEVDNNVDSLVEGVLGLLGGLVGGLLEGLGALLPIIGDLKLGDVIRDLLTLKQKSPDLFATGSFAGRIVGDVHVENCTVDKVSVTSAKGISGGFVGFTEGVETYDGLSGLLGTVVKVLSTLLNIVPGVGLGDLITVLLQNDVPLGNLIPTGYHNPVIAGCSVTLKNEIIGNATQDYNGGFVGIQTGTRISNSSVSGLTTVQAKNGAGGFAGLERDAIIKGLLNDAGITLYEIDAKSRQEKCAVNGQNLVIETTESYAGGFNGAMANSISSGSTVSGLLKVKAGKYAGGFAGRATIGFGTTLGGDDEKKPTLVDSVSKLLEKVLASGSEAEKNQLLTLAGVMPSKIYGCTVAGNDLMIESTGDYAGGMIGQGDGVKITTVEGVAFGGKVTGLKQVKAKKYAGGIAGSVVTADAIGVLNNTLGVGQFIPFELSQISAEGTDWTVTATEKYAAGACGLMLGGTADSVKVNGIQSIQAGNYAGGFAGRTGASSLVSAGGLDVLGLVKLNNVLSLANGIQVTIKNCETVGVNTDVNTGLTVLSDGTAALTDGEDFTAGGFIGESVASIVKSSHVRQLKSVSAKHDKTKASYAGGFIGRSHTGGLAGLAQKDEDGNLKLPGILEVDSLLSLVPYLLPEYTDTTVTFISNGEKPQVEGTLAGGFAGAMQSGKVDNRTSTEAFAVFGLEKVKGESHAGGFAGKVDAGATASSDGLNLLGGILNLDIGQLLNVLQVYIYGPLRKVDMDTWNKWAEAVGSNGVYGDQFPSTPVTTEEELQSLIQQYAYGYNVKAGRTNVGTQDMEAGVAGGYVGRMKAGVVTNAHAWDAKFVSAYTSAGGFAGEMKTGGVAEVGKVSLIGLDITGSISAVQTFVPVIRNSDITGFQSGMTVKATGIPVKDSTLKIEKVGYAGGYVGHMLGGQIWGNWSEASTYGATDAVPDPNNKRCFVANLRKVEGTKTIGGFAGQIDPASAAALDTAGSSGLLGGLLQSLIKTPGDLLSLLNTTVSTVRGADVDAWDKWGIIVNGAYANGSGNTAYAKAAGGFAGEINGAVIGEMNTPDSGVHVSNIRSVTGGEYVGGFLGLADVSAVAQVSDGGNTNILAELLKLGGTSVLDAFRTFVYASDVSGAAEAGLEVRARDSKKTEYVNDPVYSGSAGGFGGALLNGSVKDSKVTNLRKVNGMNYTGGFIGHLGKSGTVDLDNLGALGKLLSAGAGVMDIFGSHVDRCSVSGVTEGFTVHSDNTIDKQDKSEIAGDFTGYADLGRMTGNEVTGLKQVTSNQIAGGYAGKTNFAYLVDIKVNSDLVKYLVQAVNQILKALQLDNLQKGDVIKIDLGIIKINALYDGELVALNLLGLDIKVGLAKDKSLATIYIGDSKIEINCSEGGTIDEESLKNEINISLIKANRTRIDSCTVTGVKEGYDVYGGGAGNNANGTGDYGIAGGFIGWNNEGLFRNNKMFLADVVRGAKDLTGPFTGKASLKSNWDFNDIVGIEGDENYYQIYRQGDMVYNDLLGSSGVHLEERHDQWDSWKNIYTIRHMTENKVVKFKDLKDALMGNGTAKEPVNVYQEDGAMAVLMNNTASTPTEPGGSEAEPDVQDPCKDLIELRIKKVWKGDDEKDRPNEVIFHVTRSYVVNGETFKDETFKEEVILTKEDAQTSDTWEKVLSGEKFTAYYEDVDGKKYHYTYHISETKVDGYETTVTYQGDHQYNITVTNKKNWFDSLLPETGGLGTALLYTLGVLLLCFVTTTGYKKSKRRQGGYK